MNKIPLFPLSSHILPGGEMSLRIFEPRYVRMIKEVCRTDSEFVMCMSNSNASQHLKTQIYPIGTRVKICDFSRLDSGLLGVRVVGHQLVNIHDVVKEEDGLYIGRIAPIAHWDKIHLHQTDVSVLQNRLKEIFSRYSDMKYACCEPQFCEPLWVIYRWLEILPIDPLKKQEFLQHETPRPTLDFLQSVIE